MKGRKNRVAERAERRTCPKDRETKDGLHTMALDLFLFRWIPCDLLRCYTIYFALATW